MPSIPTERTTSATRASTMLKPLLCCRSISVSSGAAGFPPIGALTGEFITQPHELIRGPTHRAAPGLADRNGAFEVRVAELSVRAVIADQDEVRLVDAQETAGLIRDDIRALRDRQSRVECGMSCQHALTAIDRRIIVNIVPDDPARAVERSGTTRNGSIGVRGGTEPDRMSALDGFRACELQ